MSTIQKWLSVTAVTIFTLTQFLFMTPNAVFACSCMPSESVAAERDMATAVFAGEVTEIDEPGGLVISSADPVQVTFTVSEVWKGPQQPTITVTTPRDSASCGVYFETGTAYLVYAVGNEDELQVFLCSRTAPLASATTDLAALGEATPPVAAEEPAPLFSPQMVIVVLVVLLLGVIIGLFWQRARHGRKTSSA